VNIIGFGTDENDPVSVFAKKEYGITARDFIIRQLPNLSPEGTLRAAFMTVEIEATCEGEIAQYQFTLPKGSYATVVIEFLEENGYLKARKSPGTLASSHTPQ
jgi:tRNA(Glu) U13 pseudouridine synthase TruD